MTRPTPEERQLRRRQIWTTLKWLRRHYDVHFTSSDVQVVTRAKFGWQPSGDQVRTELRKALECGWILGWCKQPNPYQTSRYGDKPAGVVMSRE